MRIVGDTKIFGVIGYPITHSLSPAMHNAAFNHMNIDAAYVAIEVKPGGLKEAIEAVRGLGISGINVTIPHKENVRRHLSSVDREAKLIGAVNTIVNKNGSLHGYNTDCYGFIRSLKEDLKLNPKGKNVFIIGAGGAAKAVAYSLALNKAGRITLTDEIDDKAAELACDIELKTGCECFALQMGSIAAWDIILNSDLLINASPCGMRDKDPVVVNPALLHKGLRVFDLVYNRDTKLLKACRRKGINSTGGLNMLLYQGARAFELWTGKRPPVGVMKKALGKLK
ncbi:MAG: shikimate dehydrogenase [Candidatus Omnitrophica bacterium]|nr:shikimate dehydrogenase [Candidatus Omnitrophota bacterium]